MFPSRSHLAILAVVVTGCSNSEAAEPPDAAPPTTTATTTTVLATTVPTTTAPTTTTSSTTTTTTTTTTTSTTTTTTIPTEPLRGRVLDPEGDPLQGAVVSVGDAMETTGKEGRFRIEGRQPGPVRITRPGWIPEEIDWQGDRLGPVTLEPRIVKGLRAIPEAAGNPNRYTALLDLAEATAVNAIVFDTKDETGMVRYNTQVEKAAQMDAINPTYDPNTVIEQAKERGLYTITRIVTFEDSTWSTRDADAKLAGYWVDPANEDNWEYPLDLAVEACRAGFDEIQFDYVRFPDGRTAQAAADQRPITAEERVAAIRGFLAKAKKRLHRHGCAVSAAIFGIVVSSPTDQGIGQRPEELSPMVDAISPMLYPSHYSAGWLGFDDPNDHPKAVTADGLDNAAARLHATTILRPWLQGFYWNSAQIRGAIDAAEARGHGWIIWNAAGNYDREALPPPE